MDVHALHRWLVDRLDTVNAPSPNLADLHLATAAVGELGEHACRLGLPNVFRRCQAGTVRGMYEAAREILSEAVAEIRRASQEGRGIDPPEQPPEPFTASRLAKASGRPYQRVCEDLRNKVIPADRWPGTNHWRISFAVGQDYIARASAGTLPGG